MKSVVFYPRAMAEQLIPQAGDVIVSIHDRSQEPATLKSGWSDVLRLSFHDTDVASAEYDLFDDEQAGSVLNFIGKHAEAERIVVHCNMGVSRSAAVAMFISEQQDRVLFQQGRKFYQTERPTQYNRLVYSTLNRAAWGSGPSAFEDMPSP